MASAEKGETGADRILKESVNGARPGLTKKFTDESTDPPGEFILKKNIPEPLANSKGAEAGKSILRMAYSLIWNYESGTTYWIIEKMRKVSKDSQRKIEHFGYENYLKDNLRYMEDSLDYALKLHMTQQEIDEKEVRRLASESQQRLQEAGDAKAAPFIKMNPLNYLSGECVRAKEKIILFKIKDNLKLFGSESDSPTYSDLIRDNYSSEEYREYVSEFIHLNKAYFDALNHSKATFPFAKKLAYPLVSLVVWKETANAHEFVVKLYDFLFKNIYGTPKDE